MRLFGFHRPSQSSGQHFNRAVAVTAPLVGLLADRLGRRRVIVPQRCSLAVPTLLAATSQTFEQLCSGVLTGVFLPGVFAATVAYISKSGQWVWAGDVCLLGPRSGLRASHRCRHRRTLLVANRLCWVGDSQHCGLPVSGRYFHRSAGTHVSSEGSSILQHLRNPLLLATYTADSASSTLASASRTNFYLAGPPFHWSTASLGMLFASYLVAAAITSSCGHFIDRFGHGRAVVWARPSPFPNPADTDSQRSVDFAGLTIGCSGSLRFAGRREQFHRCRDGRTGHPPWVCTSWRTTSEEVLERRSRHHCGTAAGLPHRPYRFRAALR
jgi:hypothetical protein